MTNVRSSTFLNIRPVFLRTWDNIFSTGRSDNKDGELTRTFPRGCWEKRKYTPFALFNSINTSRSGRLPEGPLVSAPVKDVCVVAVWKAFRGVIRSDAPEATAWAHTGSILYNRELRKNPSI